MYQYEVQLLGRDNADFDRHMKAVEAAELMGPIGFRSYFFAGIRNLIVLLSEESDVQRVIRSVPYGTVIGSWRTAPPIARAA